MASIESRNLIHHDSSLSSDNEDLDVDGESAASIMESVREQEQQFAILTKEIENERRTVAKQLNHDRLNNMVGCSIFFFLLFGNAVVLALIGFRMLFLQCIV